MSWCASSTDAAPRPGFARGVALVATAQLAIGAAAIFARYALTGAGPLAVSAGRLTIAGAILLGLLVLRRRPQRRDRATEGRLALAGLALAAHFACWIASLEYTSVAISTLLVTTSPVFTEIARAVNTQRLRPIALASIALATAGAALVAFGPHLVAHVARPEPALGAILAIGGAIAIACYLLLVRESDAAYDTLAVVGRTYPIAAVALLAASAFARQGPPAPGATAAWAGIVAMALVSQLFGHTAINAAVRTFSATFVAISTLIEPVIAAAFAAWLFDERLGWTTLGGAVVILAGIGLALYDESTAPEP